MGLIMEAAVVSFEFEENLARALASWATNVEKGKIREISIILSIEENAGDAIAGFDNGSGRIVKIHQIGVEPRGKGSFTRLLDTLEKTWAGQIMFDEVVNERLERHLVKRGYHSRMNSRCNDYFRYAPVKSCS